MSDEPILTLLEQIVFFLAIVLWSSLITGLAVGLRFFQMPATQKNIPSKISLWDLLIAFAVFLTLSMIIAPILGMVVLSWHEGRWVNMAEITAQPILTAQVNILTLFFIGLGMLSFFALLPKTVQEGVWKNFHPIFKNIGFGLLTWFVSYPWILVISLGITIAFTILGIPPVEEEQAAVLLLKSAAENRGFLYLMSVLLITTVPIVEEMLFRGFLQNWLKGFFSFKSALIITSIVFAFFHVTISQGIKNIELVLSLFVLSCFLGFIYERQQSLWAPIGLHATFNALSVIAILHDL